MSRFFACFAVQKAAAARRNGLLPLPFCRHSIQHEGTPTPSYSPCETERFFSKQRFFDKKRGAVKPLLFSKYSHHTDTRLSGWVHIPSPGWMS